MDDQKHESDVVGCRDIRVREDPTLLMETTIKRGDIRAETTADDSEKAATSKGLPQESTKETENSENNTNVSSAADNGKSVTVDTVENEHSVTVDTVQDKPSVTVDTVQDKHSVTVDTVQDKHPVTVDTVQDKHPVTVDTVVALDVAEPVRGRGTLPISVPPISAMLKNKTESVHGQQVDSHVHKSPEKSSVQEQLHSQEGPCKKSDSNSRDPSSPGEIVTDSIPSTISNKVQHDSKLEAANTTEENTTAVDSTCNKIQSTQEPISNNASFSPNTAVNSQVSSQNPTIDKIVTDSIPEHIQPPVPSNKSESITPDHRPLDIRLQGQDAAITENIRVQEEAWREKSKLSQAMHAAFIASNKRDHPRPVDYQTQPTDDLGSSLSPESLPFNPPTYVPGNPATYSPSAYPQPPFYPGQTFNTAMFDGPRMVPPFYQDPVMMPPYYPIMMPPANFQGDQQYTQPDSSTPLPESHSVPNNNAVQYITPILGKYPTKGANSNSPAIATEPLTGISSVPYENNTVYSQDAAVVSVLPNIPMELPAQQAPPVQLDSIHATPVWIPSSQDTPPANHSTVETEFALETSISGDDSPNKKKDILPEAKLDVGTL